MKFALGKNVKFGTHVHIMHVESGYFFDIMQHNINESSFQLRLAKLPSRSSVFLFESIHKLRSHNSRVQLTDEIVIFHEKSEMYLNLEPSDDKNNLGFGRGSYLSEERSVYEYDLSTLNQDQKLQVVLRSTDTFWKLHCVKKWNASSGNLLFSNTLVRVNFPSFDTYMCADYVYEVAPVHAGRKREPVLRVVHRRDLLREVQSEVYLAAQNHQVRR